jgi:hypothetical protein
MNSGCNLERRIQDLSLEIRNYPTPIAGCDEQLGALLEERARLIALLERPACEPLELWVNDGGPSRR